MNKTKKIAFAAVSFVMAASMALSITACNTGSGDDNSSSNDNSNNSSNSGSVTTPAAGAPSTDSNGKLKYDANTNITLSIGYNSDTTGISYKSGNDKVVGKTLMGKSWSELDLKPAWQELQDTLGVKFKDDWSYAKESGQASANLSTTKSKGFDKVDVFSASVSLINTEGTTNGTLLDLNDYLDYMPNYKAFLESSPIIHASLLANTSGTMYVAPYFDGNDDIEKFVLLRKDIVESILDNDLPTTGTDSTFKVQGAKALSLTSTSATAFMGSTDYTVETTNPASLTGTQSYGNDKSEVSDNSTVNVKVNYTAALAAAKDESSALGSALKAAYPSISLSTLDSGNIVDLQNAVINGTNGEVSGKQLINILRAYIDVAYTTESGAQFYSTANGLTRASVFNSACAAWDVDLYVALGRCYVSSGTLFAGSYTSSTNKNYLLSGRTNDDQRQSDVYSMVGELYGVRGLESRYNFSYIDKDGNVVDTRYKDSTWDALNAFSGLVKEGLVNLELAGGDYGTSDQRNNYETLSLHDYAQTQTKGDGYKTTITSSTYNFAPVLTPVSNWDTDEDGTADTIMRFTESWRSVKTEGIAVSKNVASDPNKLAAVLAMIDYIYSSDGQILMTYGPYSSNGNTNPNGLWYATEKSDVSVDSIVDSSKTIAATNYASAQYTIRDEYKSQYFIYKGKVYEGTYYKGKQIPTLTTENLTLFAATSNNFTNHARQNLGTCLPVGVKDQGFEYQCTATCGLVGSQIVNVALTNGTIQHPVQDIDSSNYWYTLLPTQLPYAKQASNALSSGNVQFISGVGGSTSTIYCAESKQHANLLINFMKVGYSSTPITINSQTIDISTSAKILAANDNLGMQTLIYLKNVAFSSLVDWYNAQA
jgi:putative aldouronate transport system substrate-binding protein